MSHIFMKYRNFKSIKPACSYYRFNPITRRIFSNQVKKATISRNDLGEFYHLIKSERKDFFLICILSAVTSTITMLFPHALKGIGQLSSLKVSKNESDEEVVNNQSHAESPLTQDTINNPPTNTNEKAIAPNNSLLNIAQNIKTDLNKSAGKALSSPTISNEKDMTKMNKADVTNQYLKFLGIWIPIFIASGALTYFRRYLTGDIANKIAYRLRYKLYSHLIDKDLTFFINKKSNSSDYVHKLSNDITTVSNSVTMDFTFFLRGAIWVFGSTCYIIINSPQLAIASVMTMGALTLATKNIAKKLRESKIQEAASLTNLSIIAGERLSNMKLIKANNTEEFEKQNYLKALDQFYNDSTLVSKYTALNYGILDGLGQMSAIGILVYGSYLVSFGYMGSEMIAFSMYALYAGIGFRSMFNSYTELKKSAGLYAGIHDIIGSIQENDIFKMKFDHLRAKIETTAISKQIKDLELLKLNKPPKITFNKVTFSYDGYDILKNISFDMEPGTIIALVGPSGTGKSTVLNLLTKLYEPTSGEIEINGQNITELSPEWVRANVSYVTQEPILFMGTILDNIRYGNEGFDISEENVLKMAKIAAADEFIQKLPEKYNTKIGEKGLTLSGGQRQKIVIARSLIKDPKILILDESTSSLDQESEISIVKGLKDVCKNRTCLIVTHKIENYRSIIDKFIVLEANKDNTSSSSITQQSIQKMIQFF